MIVEPTFEMYAALRAMVGARVVAPRSAGADFRFPLDRAARGHHAGDAGDLPHRSEQSRRASAFLPARSRRIAEPRPHALVLRRRGLCRFQRPHAHRPAARRDAGTSSSAARSPKATGSPGCASARSSRIPTRSNSSQRAAAAVQRQHLRDARRSTAALDDRALPRLVRRGAARIARAGLRLLPASRARSTGRARPTSCSSASGPDVRRIVGRPRRARHSRSRQVGVARLRRLHPAHRRRRRAHDTGAWPPWRTSLRRARIDRQTTETQIQLALNLDGRGRYDVDTGIRFLDHMLELFARHGGFDLTIAADGRPRRGRAPHRRGRRHRARRGRARGARRRSAASTAPATSSCRWTRRWPSPPSICPGRPFAVVDLTTSARRRVGDLPTELVQDFFEGFANAGARQRAPEGAVRPVEPSPDRSRVQGVRARAARRLLEGSAARDACCRRRRACCEAIALVDYGAGNLTSVIKGFDAVGADVRVVSDARRSRRRERDRRPRRRPLRRDGVARCRRGATRFASAIERGVPLLGICLGLQWLFEGSDEAPDAAGSRPACPAAASGSSGDVKVPHVGWNTLDRIGRPSRLLDGVPAARPPISRTRTPRRRSRTTAGDDDARRCRSRRRSSASASSACSSTRRSPGATGLRDARRTSCAIVREAR